VTLPAGATVADAVAASGLVARLGLARNAIAFAIYGQRADGAIPLRDGDRVEITRPLIADPKEARRTRAAQRPLKTPR
jgi:putative ubiquitin-RnfH superfamily antitoxin RatB of RatAB toxin-antitoxin module